MPFARLRPGSDKSPHVVKEAPAGVVVQFEFPQLDTYLKAHEIIMAWQTHCELHMSEIRSESEMNPERGLCLALATAKS